MDGGALPPMRCDACGHLGADVHTLLCPHCLVALPPYFRAKAERLAIQAALMRRAFIEEPMGGIRWTEQQYREHLRKQQQPAPVEPRKAGKPPANKPPKGTLVFHLPLTPMRNGLDRMHFRAKRRLMQELGDTMRQQLPIASGIPFAHARVEIVRHSAVEPDPDGLAGSVKPILDAMQVPRTDTGKRGTRKLHPYGAYIIENDNSDCIDLFVRWEKCPPKHGKVMVYVTPQPARP